MLLKKNFVIMDKQQQINHLLGYTINHVHKIQEHIDYMYHWMSKLTMSSVYEFYMEHPMLIILNSLFEEWIWMWLSLKYRLESLYFNNLANEMLLEREHQYTEMCIRCIEWSIGCLDATAKFIPWFAQNDLGGHDFDKIDDVIGDPN